ncbi:MAG: polysaccharide biosynthesis tyrosine autokinase [Anaerolineae bacterium]|nr:polysaccharide biosynthesis tyrosine autokinase [Anaerolineae bacterium]
MDLKLYLDILRRHALIIVIVVAVAVLMVIVKSLLTAPIYNSSVTVRVLLDPGIAEYSRGVANGDRLMKTYEFILLSDPIWEKVVERLGPRGASLPRQLDVESISETELIRITAGNEDPVLARDLANTVAAVLVDYAQNYYVGSQSSTRQIIEEQLDEIENNLETERATLDERTRNGAPAAEIEMINTRIRNLEASQTLLWTRYATARLGESLQANSVTIVQPATLPTRAANQIGLSDIGLALALGLAGAIGLALVLENLNTRIRNPQQLERMTGLPVLGTVPRGQLPLGNSGNSGRMKTNELLLIEAYRLLGLNLKKLGQSSQLKTILVTSAVPDEGKTTVATNLAWSLAEDGKMIFLIDGDLRRPSLDERFGTGNGHTGLSSVLTEFSSLDQVTYATEQPTLFVLGGGPPPNNPSPLLASPRMSHVLDYFGSQGQLALIDAPSVLGVSDVSILAPKVDGVILVAQENVTSQELACQALKQLQTIEANVLGWVFVRRSSKSQAYV